MKEGEIPDRRVTRRAQQDRFWSKVDMTGECWIWTASLKNGYGCFWWNNKIQYAHRLAYEWKNGPIPEGRYVDHICRNEMCVHPEHLRVVTGSQNNQNHGGAQKNSKSGIRGVSWHSGSGKWYVVVSHNKKRHFGGQFDDLEEAKQRAIALRNELFTHNEIDRKESR